YLESLSGGPDHIGSGHSHVLEGDSTSIGASLTEVDLLLSHVDSGSVGLDCECSECLSSGSLRVGIRSGENEEPAQDSSIGDPHLRSIDHVLVALLD
ncbi:hypothetical protein PMAYCL1PPCAC_02087, partial [Pristionchus mayeri]